MFIQIQQAGSFALLTLTHTCSIEMTRLRLSLTFLQDTQMNSLDLAVGFRHQ